MTLHNIFIFASLGFQLTFITVSTYRIFWKNQRGTTDHFYLFLLGVIFLALSIAT